MLGEQLTMDVGHLAHELRVRSPRPRAAPVAADPGSGQRLPRRARARAGRRAPSRRLRRGPPRATRPGERSNPGASTRIASSHSSTVRAIGPAWSNEAASGKQASSETRPQVGLNPTTAHQAAGIRIEPPESVPSARSASPAASAAALAAARAAGEPAGRARVRHRPVVRVLRRDPVGELVQVRLADVHVAGLLEQRDRGRGSGGDVLGEEDRAVGRRQTLGVEEILDGQANALRRGLRLREEDPVRLARAAYATSSERACE